MGIFVDSGIHSKTAVVKAILKVVDQEIEILERSAQEAHEGATHEDAVAKSKYDTHGLELSYLAGSQYERARKLATSSITLAA